MNFKSFYLKEETTTLNDIYGSRYDVDRSEAIHNFANSEADWSEDFEIKQYTPEELSKLLTTTSTDMTILDAYKKFAKKAQKDLVKKYMDNDSSRNDEPIVIAGKTLVDGYHRAVAAILKKIPIKGINIY